MDKKKDPKLTVKMIIDFIRNQGDDVIESKEECIKPKNKRVFGKREYAYYQESVDIRILC